MLLVNPYLLLHDPGFQLSFLATLALILLAPYVEEKLSFVPETIGLRKIVAATITTQIFVLPLLLYHTGLFSSVSVLVNASVLPMVPVAMLLTFLTGIIGIFFEPLGILIGFVAYCSLEYIIVISEFFGSLPLSSTMVNAFPAWVMFVAYIVMAWGVAKLAHTKEDITSTPEKDFKTDGWAIEEEIEKTGDSQSESPAGLPFR